MSAKNKELVEKLNEGFSKNNNEFYLAYLADDIRWNIIGKSIIIGKSNFLKAMKMEELESFPVITIKNIIAEGKYVVVESTGKAATKTGKPYKPAYCDIYRIKNGKIQEMTTYFVDRSMKGEIKMKSNKTAYPGSIGKSNLSAVKGGFSGRKEILTKINGTITELLQLVSSLNQGQINTIPFEGSWTAGQLAQHMIKANSGFVQMLYGSVGGAKEKPDQMVGKIKADFLDFNTKAKSADIIAPENINYKREVLLNSLEKIKADLNQAVLTLDLTKTCLTFELPVYGFLTRLEAVYFVIYHTQRHIHQLKNIFQKLYKPKA